MFTEPNSAPKPSSAPRNAHNKEEPSHNTYFQRVKENKTKKLRVAWYHTSGLQ